ncbi:MAG: alpha/beta fold hydrolase [Proteobacteria bacterium]|nr:alpha/beta fold hydrolase [Pseudomonadota bacterium]
MPRIDVGHITLNYAERGEGPALVFIPGLVGLLDAWEFQMAHFAARYRCVAFDHRGCGDSDKPEDSYSTQLIARDVIALMDRLGIARAHVAGTSTGGCVLQNLAIDHAPRLRCCVFSNTWVKADEYITRVQMTRKRIALSYGAEEYVKLSSLFTNGAMQFRHDLDKVMELERRALKTVAPVAVLAGRLDMTLAHDRTGELHKIRNPALVIGTRDDATVPVYQSEDLHKAIGGSRLIIVEEGGHYSYRRHWWDWNRLVGGFLDEYATGA